MTEVQILIVGGASLDTLEGTDQVVAGGAGMYTAMSARRSGAQVTLYAPRPDPMPNALSQIASRLTWLGPSIAQKDLAHFEITYRHGQATYVNAFFGAEGSLSPTELPNDLSAFDYVHIVPLGNIRKQHEFMRVCREKGGSLISAGTALDLINERPTDAAAVLNGADVFFMNEEEAVRLFGSMSAVCSRPGQFIFVTKGRAGVTVVQGECATDLPGVSAAVVDPTGAGDSFCGATLVNLAMGLHPVMAARQATPLAAQMTENIGPITLLASSPLPPQPLDSRVVVNAENVVKIGAQIGALPQVAPFPFTGPDLPPLDHPRALDYFFAATLQQFGFWTASNGRYERPLIATVSGEERKGSFYLFRAYLSWLEHDPEILSPAGQAGLTKADLRAVLRADDGTCPMPALDLHLSQARRYGQDMLALNLTPRKVLQQANSSASPLRALIALLDRVGGYKEDPLRKKTALLSIILQQRPELFLAADDRDVPPAIDYHLMRSCLRNGLIDVVDDELANKLVGRELLTEDDEWAVRAAAHDAIEQVVAASGKTMGAVDWFFFQARKRCPEMSEPRCRECPIDPVCAHRKELFQPAWRTSFY